MDGSVRLASAAGRWVLAVAVLGEAMILLEATVVNVALPTIGRDLGAGVAGLQWTLNGYVLTLAALVLVGGSFSDIYGRRRIFTYAALGGVIFLFVAFLQITLGYTALQAGAATLPITVLLLALSTPSGAIAQRIGPRIPLTAGALLAGAGLLLMAQIHPGDRYLPAVLPSLIVFGAGLAALITPITATVLASVDSRHSGIASAVSNALSRLGQMIAVAALPLAAGLSGSAFQDPAKMAAGFPVAMTVAAGASFAAALLAWTTISNDVLSRSATGTQHVPKELPPSLKRHCPVAGTPLAAPLNSPPSSRPPTAKEP